MATIKQYTDAYNLKRIRIFSEEVKKKIVKDLEHQLINISEVTRDYEVSRTSIYNWIYRYSGHKKRGERIVVESKSQEKKVTELKERIKELERIIGQKQILIDFKDKMIEIAEETYKVDIKKKLGTQLSSGIGETEREKKLK
jgi:transposase-like protein